MPHAQLTYSEDIELNAVEILKQIETVILQHDAGAGDCKGRAMPVVKFHHTHLMADVSLLPEAHRDAEFLAALRSDLFGLLSRHVPRPCWLSLDLRFSTPNYQTEFLT